MNPVTEDVKDKLVAESLGVFALTNDSDFGIFIGLEPPLPNQCITLYDSGAAPPGYSLDEVPPMNSDTFQVRVRAPTYLLSNKRLLKIDKFLAQIARFDTTGPDSADPTVHYETILRISGPFYLLKDGDDRHIWVANFMAKRQEIS